MSVRRNNFGRRPSAAGAKLVNALELTRQQVEIQPAGAPFTSTPPTSQWPCACGNVNPSSKSKCRACGERREGSAS